VPEWEIDDEDWPEEPTEATNGTILIVDDDPSIRTMLAFIFEDEGYVATEAADGAAALAALRGDPPAAMVLDLMMPDVDGLEVLRVRKQEGLAPDTRVVILTAKTDVADEVFCWEHGADEYVRKPVDPDELLREVVVLLRCTPDEVRERREVGLAEAKRLDSMEAAFTERKHRH
jgi:two-component system alkaline phosphatase synthesis response regulator PhoP